MYFLIGISLLFTYLYAVNLLGSLLAAAVWKFVLRRSGAGSRRGRADVLFMLRVMPLAAAIVATFALLVPSFLLFEPHESGESIGWKLAVLVSVSLAGIGAAAHRIFASWWRTRRLVAEWIRDAEEFELEGSGLPAYRFEHPFPVLAVIGVLRPKIFVATQVLEALSVDELNAALAHELGHIKSRDNLKRTAMRLCRDMLVLPVGKGIDRAWLELAESAADEFASTKKNALDLASALVKIGRITPPGRAWELPAGAYLTEPEDGSLASRVEDLVQNAGRPVRYAKWPFVSTFAALLILISIALPASSGQVLSGVHELTESVINILE